MPVQVIQAKRDDISEGKRLVNGWRQSIGQPGAYVCGYVTMTNAQREGIKKVYIRTWRTTNYCCMPKCKIQYKTRA